MNNSEIIRSLFILNEIRIRNRYRVQPNHYPIGYCFGETNPNLNLKDIRH